IITPSSTAWPPIGAAIATQTDARAKPARPDDGTASSASGTACPPIGALTTSDGGLGGLRPLEAALEPLHPATRVDELLLPRVERVAVRADLDVQLGFRRASLELVAARAAHGCEDVLGMDAGLHRRARIAAAVSVETLPPETTTATAFALFSGTFPARSAASPTAPAASQASFARP